MCNSVIKLIDKRIVITVARLYKSLFAVYMITYDLHDGCFITGFLQFDNRYNPGFLLPI